MIEQWKTITDFNNFLISNFGRLKNDKTGRILKQTKMKSGYLTVSVKPNGKYSKCKTFKIHQEVARAFIENIQNKPVINHKDGNKLNNHFLNLEWVTSSENTIHAYEHSLMIETKGMLNGNSILTDDNIKFISNNPHMKNIELAEIFNVHRSTIYKVRNKINWKHIK